MLGARAKREEPPTIEERERRIRQRLLDKIEDAIETRGEIELRWKGAGILQGLCAAYASMARLDAHRQTEQSNV